MLVPTQIRKAGVASNFLTGTHENATSVSRSLEASAIRGVYSGVGAAWAMMQMTSSAELIALVQTASMLPIMPTSLAAGAIADMYDRRIVGWLLCRSALQVQPRR